MLESHHQLEIKILCPCLNISTHPGESPQPLTKVDENPLLRPPYPTSMLFQDHRWAPNYGHCYGHFCQRQVLDGWVPVLCRVSFLPGISVIYSFSAHLLSCHPWTPAQAPAKCSDRSNSSLTNPPTSDFRPLATAWVSTTSYVSFSRDLSTVSDFFFFALGLNLKPFIPRKSYPITADYPPFFWSVQI